MTFAVLRALHAIIGDALIDIERVYADSASNPPSPALPSSPRSATSPPASPILPSTSPPRSPLSPTTPRTPSLDFPSLDAPYDASSPSEALTTDPIVVCAVNRIVAACGQMGATVRKPFLSLCDASMGYHLPSCMRFLESTHIVEILRSASPGGMHVDEIAKTNGCDVVKLSHILRLLATHHIVREVKPDVFANNRISGFMDTGKDPRELILSPEKKYDGTDGISAFVGLCTDELFKSSAYMTDAYTSNPTTRFSRDTTHTPFNEAFGTKLGFFAWLESESQHSPNVKSETQREVAHSKNSGNNHRYRLERFGKAMSGTGAWERPGAVLNALDYTSLPPSSIVVDVGGGIGSTTMVLAEAFGHLKFVVQDREVVVGLGKEAWKSRCPELLEEGRTTFQVHDFFTPQPIKNASLFILRVVLHDWPDTLARRILLLLREAAVEGNNNEEGEGEGTRLIIAEFVLPLACVDDFGSGGVEAGVKGAERTLAPLPLLANLGKASANVYWMDLTMQVMFNSQERTLREIVELALSAGWKVVKVTRDPGSLFGHIIAVPVPIPIQRRARAGSGSALLDVRLSDRKSRTVVGMEAGEQEMMETASALSRSGTPTFGSKVDLPPSMSMDDLKRRFGGASKGGSSRGRGVGLGIIGGLGRGIVLEKKCNALVNNSPKTPSSTPKKRPSPLVNPLLMSPGSPTHYTHPHHLPPSPISTFSLLKRQPSSSSLSSRIPQSPSPPVPLLPPNVLKKRMTSSRNLRGDPAAGVGGAVLAAAARIERGLPMKNSS